MKQTSKVLMPLGPGFEEIEALTVVDILRRAGVDIIIAGTVPGPVQGRNKIMVVPDDLLDNVIHETYDMIYIPGGPGTDKLNEDQRILQKLRDMQEKKQYIASICAGPKVLHTAGILKGIRVTSFPATKNALTDAVYSEDRVVTDGNIITSRGAGTTLEFALKLVEILAGKEKSEEIKKSIIA